MRTGTMEMETTGKVSRRDFGKMSAAAAGFAIISSKVMASEPSSTDTLKIGLLGCGGRGSGAIEQMLQGNENVKVIALADLFKDKVDSVRKKIQENQNTKIRNKYAIEDDHCFTGFDA